MIKAKIRFPLNNGSLSKREVKLNQMLPKCRSMPKRQNKESKIQMKNKKE